MSECPNAMLSVALPQAQLTAAAIAQARAAHWMQTERVQKCNAISGIAPRVNDGNAVGGIANGAAHSCDDQASLGRALAAARASVR